jgi:glyoxylase I family protein
MSIALEGFAPLLQVYDMGRSLAFYRDVLGFQIVASAPPDSPEIQWCTLALGEVAIMLNTAYEPDHRPAPEPLRREDRGLTLYFGCSDVDAAYDYLLTRSIAVEPPQTTPYGMRQLHVRDPDGFELCLQHPA